MSNDDIDVADEDLYGVPLVDSVDYIRTKEAFLLALKDDDELLNHHFKDYETFLERDLGEIVNVKFKASKIITTKTNSKKTRSLRTSDTIIKIDDKNSTTPSISSIEEIEYEIRIVKVTSAVKECVNSAGDLFEEGTTPNLCMRVGSTYTRRVIVELLRESELIGEPFALFNVPAMVGYERYKNTRKRLKMGGGLYPYEVTSSYIQTVDEERGGYFVVNGKERVIVAQVRPRYNHSSMCVRKKESICDFRTSYSTTRSTLFQMTIDRTGCIQCSLPCVHKRVSLGVLLRALCVKRDVIESSLGTVNSVAARGVLDSYDNIGDYTAACADIRSKVDDSSQIERDERASYVERLLNGQLFYSLLCVNRKCVADTVLNVGRRYCKFLLDQDRYQTDRDNLIMKRVDGVYSLLDYVYRGFYKRFIGKLCRAIDGFSSHELITFSKRLGEAITRGVNTCMTTGKWTFAYYTESYTRIGVAQSISTLNRVARLSHCRRLSLNVGCKGKIQRMRQIHSSMFGYICPFETPEGETVGLNGNLACGVRWTRPTRLSELNFSETIKVCVNSLNDPPLDDDEIRIRQPYADVILNGVTVAVVRRVDVKKLVRLLDSTIITEVREAGDDVEHSVYVDEFGDVQTLTDAGRLTRPIRDLKQWKPTETNDSMMPKITPLSFREMILDGRIRYADAAMLDTRRVRHERSTNCRGFREIYTAATSMGIMAGCVPFANHSQSPRISYQSSMGKQVIGAPLCVASDRYDTNAYEMHYVQRSLCSTRVADVVGLNEAPVGVMPVLMIGTFDGFNQEDSIILNKSSLDRGLFACTRYVTMNIDKAAYAIKVPLTARDRRYDYSPIDACFNADENYSPVALRNHHILDSNEVLFTWAKPGSDRYEHVLSGFSDSVVDRVFWNREKEEDTIIEDTANISYSNTNKISSHISNNKNLDAAVLKIRLRMPRQVEIGDKFATSSAQKGTCGLIVSAEDLPSTIEGIQPNVIMNPHAIPSRMTVNMLIEIVHNLASCRTGRIFDASPYELGIEKQLRDLFDDFEESRGVRVMDGRSGVYMRDPVFMGPVCYQRLKHIVDEKIHARTTGAVDELTHQPLSGRSRNGGLRFGEMEKDCINAHGAASIVSEMLYDKSDAYSVRVCRRCGRIVDTEDGYCSACALQNSYWYDIPYATHLMFHYYRGMGISCRFLIDSKDTCDEVQEYIEDDDRLRDLILEDGDE